MDAGILCSSDVNNLLISCEQELTIFSRRGFESGSGLTTETRKPNLIYDASIALLGAIVD